MNKRYEVVVSCATWDETAPWGMTGGAEVLSQATLEAARRLAAELAAGHGAGCVVVVREANDDMRQRIKIEQVCGTRVEDERCDCSERSIIGRMTEHGEPRDEIRSRILWAHGHGFLGDDQCIELLEVAGSACEGSGCANDSEKTV